MTNAANWTLVVAIAQNGVIGRGDALPWKLSSDLQRFKRMTMGHCLLMGRKTYESIGRPLPGRQTIVLSRSAFSTRFPEVVVVPQLSDVAAQVDPNRRVMVVGGAQIYAAALPSCNTIWLTRVLADVPGDTYFPEVDWSAWECLSSESIEAGSKDEWPTVFQIWRRRTSS